MFVGVSSASPGSSCTKRALSYGSRPWSFHVLGHLVETARLAPLDWLDRAHADIAGARWRQWAVAASVALGVPLGLLLIGRANSWFLHRFFTDLAVKTREEAGSPSESDLFTNLGTDVSSCLWALGLPRPWSAKEQSLSPNLRHRTSMRAPPPGPSPTRHFPPVERTTASAIASPSPAPSPPLLPRWNLSNRKGRCSAGIPGPLSSTARLTNFSLALTVTRTDPPSPA